MAGTVADYQKQYNTAKAAGDSAGMATAHAGAEAVRAQNGYSGGADGSKVVPLTPLQTVVNLGVNTAISKAGSSKKAKKVSTAPTPAAIPAVAPQPAANTDLTNLIKQYLDNQSSTNQQTAQARSGQQAALKNLLSPEGYTAILEKTLAANMPTYETGKTELEKEYAKNGEFLNSDAEKRGIFNSGIETSLQSQNNDAKLAALAKLYAEIQATSAGQAKDTIGQQLQGVGMQGDWTTSDASLASDQVKNAISSLLGVGNLNNDTTKINNDYTLGTESNSINRQKVDNDYDLGTQQIGIDQQNANTNKQNADTNSTQVKNNYDLGLQNIAQDKAKLAEQAREYDFSRTDSLAQFAQTMGLNWAQLGAQEKANMAEAGYRNEMLKLENSKFNSEQDLIKAQQSKDNLQTSMQAYDMIVQASKAGSSTEDLLTLIKPYATTNSALYNDLKSSINSMGTTAGASSGTSAGTATTAPAAWNKTLEGITKSVGGAANNYNSILSNIGNKLSNDYSTSVIPNIYNAFKK